MNILITGGAGYIGSHVAKQLLENTKNNILIIDNLSNSNIKTIKSLKQIREFNFYEVDLKENEKVNELIKKNKIDTIFHFAASIAVHESILNPIAYYKNNSLNTINLLESAQKNEVKKFIFSSTAAVYADVNNIDKKGINESFPTKPINPYGMSKLFSENVIKDIAKNNKDFKYVIFRYFNVAGSDVNYVNGKLEPRIGESHQEETHLIPLLLQTALAKKEVFNINGVDFNTKDGTCIRDYIHVEDLASAHILALDYLESNESDTFNIGYSNGFSVKEVLEAVKKVTKKDFKVNIKERREGDPAVLIANNEKILAKMKWKAKYDSLEFICESAMKWELKR